MWVPVGTIVLSYWCGGWYTIRPTQLKEQSSPPVAFYEESLITGLGWTGTAAVQVQRVVIAWSKDSLAV